MATTRSSLERLLAQHSLRRLYGIVHDSTSLAYDLHAHSNSRSSADLPRRREPRTRIQACSLALRLWDKLEKSLEALSIDSGRPMAADDIVAFICGKGNVLEQDKAFRQVALILVVLASKLWDSSNQIPLSSISKAPIFEGWADQHAGKSKQKAPLQLCRLESSVLNFIGFDITRTSAVQLFDDCMALVESQVPAYSERYVKLEERILDCIHILYAKHGLVGFVHEVPRPVLGAALYAAAYALVETRAPLALALALCSRVPTVSIIDFITVANALLDEVEDGEVLDGQDAVVTQTQSKVYEGVRYDAKEVSALFSSDSKDANKRAGFSPMTSLYPRDARAGWTNIMASLQREQVF